MRFKKRKEGGYMGNLPAEFEEKMIKDFCESDSSVCKYRINQRVQKATYEEGDAHPKGTKGTVLGNLPTTMGNAYLVIFDDDPEETIYFTIEYKLEEVEDD